MIRNVKAALRDALPAHLQVPVKYWYSAFRGHLEPELAVLDLLVARGDHVIDVGGNRGIYAYRLTELGAHVEVFEPNPSCLLVLQLWAATQRNVIVHGVALSSTSGKAQLTIPVGPDGVEHDSSGSLENRSDHGSFITASVDIRSLDSFGFTNTSLIKIDVEGHEYQVIEGATETLKESSPALIVEIEQRHISRPIEEVFNLIVDRGYRGFFLDGKCMASLDRFDLSVHQSIGGALDLGSGYRNNFLFFDCAKLDRGDYCRLFEARPLA